MHYLSSLLHKAAYRGDVETLAAVLMVSGVEVDARNRGGYTALDICMRKNFIEGAMLLLKYGASVDARDNRGNTPIMHMILTPHNTEMLQLFIRNGGNITATNHRGETYCDILVRNQYNWYLAHQHHYHFAIKYLSEQ